MTNSVTYPAYPKIDVANYLHQQGSFYGVQSGDVSEFFPSINTTTPHLTSTAIILPNSPVDHLTFVANPQPEAQPITYSPFNNIVDHEEIVEPMADLPVTPKILTKHQIIGQLNNLVHKELNVYHKLFCQRYAVGGWYKKCDLLRFMNLESLEFPSDFSTEHMMGILTNPGMYSPAIVAKACLELYIGRHMLILIKYAKELWCEICTKYITGYKEMISEQNQFLRPAFYDNLTLLDFIDWHKAYITEEQWYFHAGNYHIRFFQLFKKDARMPFRGGGAPIQKRELHQVSPQALKRADGVASMRKNDLIALQPTKQPRLAPNHVAQQFQTSLLILDDETIPKTPVNMQFSWDYLVPGAKEYYSINNPPEIFMTLSYTQRSDSSLMVWALTPNKDEIFLQFYNTSKTNNATKDVYSKYYECRLCGRKAGFKLTVDIHMCLYTCGDIEGHVLATIGTRTILVFLS
uniref:Transposase n=1 Tax=Acrobeloides nanus TaxID=290746 RepID=A0A914D244_9BILA